MCQCRPCTAGLQSESAELTHRDPIMCASAGGIGAGRGATCTTGSNQPECDRRSCYGKHRDLGVDFSAFSVVRCHRANGYCAVNGKDFAVGPGTAKGIGT